MFQKVSSNNLAMYMYLIKMKLQRLQRNANRWIEYTAKNITFINTDIEKKNDMRKKNLALTKYITYSPTKSSYIIQLFND